MLIKTNTRVRGVLSSAATENSYTVCRDGQCCYLPVTLYFAARSGRNEILVMQQNIKTTLKFKTLDGKVCSFIISSIKNDL